MPAKNLRGCENFERRRETISRRSRQGALREKRGSLVSYMTLFIT
jgi:hypothetical protein